MNAHEFYRSHIRFSDPGRHAHLFDALPDKVEELVRIVQGLFSAEDFVPAGTADLPS
jgi:hypothetical protein